VFRVLVRPRHEFLFEFGRVCANLLAPPMNMIFVLECGYLSCHYNISSRIILAEHATSSSFSYPYSTK
jgi:hypothetical protein